MDETMVRDTLTGAVSDVIRRMWSGQYLMLQPKNFKNTLATYHPQFQDFRQVSQGLCTPQNNVYIIYRLLCPRLLLGYIA